MNERTIRNKVCMMRMWASLYDIVVHMVDFLCNNAEEEMTPEMVINLYFF